MPQQYRGGAPHTAVGGLVREGLPEKMLSTMKSEKLVAVSHIKKGKKTVLSK